MSAQTLPEIYKIADCQCCGEPVMSSDPDMHVDVVYDEDGHADSPSGFTCYRCISTHTFACGHSQKFVKWHPECTDPDASRLCWHCQNDKPIANEDPFGDE